MSIQARDMLVNGPNTRFQRQSQRNDLLDPGRTKTQLIALLIELTTKGHIILFTAVRSDHHDDSGLGRYRGEPCRRKFDRVRRRRRRSRPSRRAIAQARIPRRTTQRASQRTREALRQTCGRRDSNPQPTSS